jgi:hypothetical protein
VKFCHFDRSGGNQSEGKFRTYITLITKIMDSNYHEAKFLTKKQQENLLAACKNLKYRLIILLMLDCG